MPDISVVWDFDPWAIPPGKIQRVRWAFAQSPDGSPATIPLIVIAGERPGKSAALTAGVHGDEFEGIHALWQLAEQLKPHEISGRLLIVPIVHGAAFNAGLRVSPIDSVNLARVFPGDPGGTITYRLAHHVFTQIVSKADILVDCHSGGVRMAFLPVAGFYGAGGDISPAAGAASLECAQQMGFPWLWSLPHRAGVLSCEAARIGIAVTGCEAGGRGGRLDSDSALYRDGIRRVLQTQGLLSGDPTPIPAYTSYLDGDWQLAPTAGLIENHVELNQRVRAGTTLATIRDSFGTPIARMDAPFDGIVMGVRHLCSVQPGEWATCVVEEKPL